MKNCKKLELSLLSKYIGFICLFTFSLIIKGQNIIQNGNLNDTIQLGGGQSIYAKDWLDSPTQSSPDYFNDFNPNVTDKYYNFVGTQFPKFQEGYLGLLLYDSKWHGQNVREYIQSQLIRPLIKDSTYCFRVWLNLADSSNYSLKTEFGAFFSPLRVDSQQIDHTILNVNPQIQFVSNNFFTDTSNWVKYDGQFMANGGESYIVLGNFNPDSLLDTTRILQSSDSMFHMTYTYFDGLWLSSCDSLPPDTLPVKLGVLEEEKYLSVYPNPFKNRVAIHYEGNGDLDFTLFNLIGKEIVINLTKISNDRYELDLGAIPKGIYFLNVSDGINRATKKIIKQ